MMRREAPPDPEQGPRAAAAALPEGAEAPPPGVRTMAIVRWVLVALMALAAVASWLHYVDVVPGTVRVAARYHCPMHPSVTQNGPGECPICGMDLVPVASEQRDPQGTRSATAVSTDAAPGLSAGGVPGLVPVEIAQKRTQLTGLRTAKAVKQALVPEVRTVGFVAPDDSAGALVTSRYGGWIQDVRVAQSGMPVTKGQVLATVNSPELTAAQQVLVNAVRWDRKQTNIAPVQTATGPEYDARRRLELYGVAREDVDRIAQTGEVMDAVPIRSPISGYVARRAAFVGLYIQPGTELYQLAEFSRVWVVADVYEADASRVQVGRNARFTLASYPGKAFTGRIDFMYPAVNPESRTVQARIAFRNEGLRLRPGMYGDVAIELAPAEGLAIPVDAVIDTGELQYVFVARDGGRFEPRRVRVGSRAGERVQVLEGLAEGERVVTTANFLVESESRLRAALESATPGVAERDRD